MKKYLKYLLVLYVGYYVVTCIIFGLTGCSNDRRNVDTTPRISKGYSVEEKRKNDGRLFDALNPHNKKFVGNALPKKVTSDKLLERKPLVMPNPCSGQDLRARSITYDKPKRYTIEVDGNIIETNNLPAEEPTVIRTENGKKITIIKIRS